MMECGDTAVLVTATRSTGREGIDFLSLTLGVDRAVAYAYLSAASDFEISQVVDRTKGVHGLIRKADFSETTHQIEDN